MTHIEPPFELRHVTRGDADYERLARQEAEFWQSAHDGFGVEVLEAGDVDSPIDRYTNGRFTGDERTPWYATISRHGPFRRGLVLGTSGMGQDARILRTNPGLHLTFCDIADESLARWQRALGARFPGRVATMTADLNFVELPANTYDLVVSSSTLHHVINLEHVAGQINGTLTDGGLFFLQDFTGESMFRFADEKKRLFELLHRRDRARRRLPDAGLVWRNEDRSLFSPFCGIRSGDILGAMASVLDAVDVRTCAAIVNLILHARPADWDGTLPRPSVAQRIEQRLRRHLPFLRIRTTPLHFQKEYLRELLFLDELVCDSGLFQPNNAFGMYRKREAGTGAPS
ncbi:MAG: class I SAM-dependent methyltransferase [Chloroflexi bacterium]|nr:class I SAM-dependent methyltransferase [Chloroflexota bacterium]